MCVVLVRLMLKRINLMLVAADFEVARRILREQGTTLSAWVRVQIKKLIARHDNQRKES